MRKKRGYSRDTPVKLKRDYKLFAIACEGGKREPGYFKIFRHLSSRIAVDIIEDIVGEEEAMALNANRSAPKWVLDRAIRYIEKEGLSSEDDLWFVMDTDKWDIKQIREIAAYCEQYPNWHIALSNPCFEVWLFFHRKANISASKSSTSQEFKYEISTFEIGGYNPFKYIRNLPNAIQNARAADSDKDHFLPKHKETKLYQWGEAILNIVGKRGFEAFLDDILPGLIADEKVKINFKRRK